MAFRLKTRATELDLPLGELVIGRGTDCFLRLDDDLVSRRHARLTVTTGVTVEDLGSRNGTRVNGRAVTGRVELAVGDQLEVGSQTFRLLETGGRERSPTATIPPVRSCIACGHVMEARVKTCPRCGSPQLAPDDDPARSISSFELLLGVGDKMLALGRIDEAEKMIGPRLREAMARAERGQTLLPEDVALALERCVRLAAATRRAEWYIFLFDLARLTRARLDEQLLDELHAHMMAHKPAAGAALQAYLDTLPANDPAQQQRRRRLEALLRFCRG